MGQTVKLSLLGLGCANCAQKIEDKTRRLDGVKKADLNFALSEIIVEYGNVSKIQVVNDVKAIVKVLEPDVLVEEKLGITHKVEHEDHESAAKPYRIALFGAGVLLFISGFIFSENDSLSLSLFLVAYLLTGYDILITAAKNILKGSVFDENFLMSLSSIGAFCIGEYPEAVAVIMFYQIGEYLQGLAVGKSRKSIKDLMNIKPDYANLVKNGEVIKTNPADVGLGSIILVKPGEKIPLDGIITEGSAFVDLSSLTGESVPEKVSVGDSVLSGSINTDGMLKIKTTKVFGESTVVKIMEMVETASAKKAPAERFITKFSRIYTPVVVGLALIMAVIPALFFSVEFSESIHRALLFLVVSCPCALVISVPLTFFAGIGDSSKRGILIKGSNYIQELSKIDNIVFDKTGTITKGVYKVVKILPEKGVSERELLEKAYALEFYSVHPIAKSIISDYESKNVKKEMAVSDYREISGYGVKGILKGKGVSVGNYKLMEKEGLRPPKYKNMGTAVYVSEDGKYIGQLIISDEIKNDAKQAVSDLKKLGLKNITMLTGDRRESAELTAKEVGIENVFYDLLPNEKVHKIEEIYDEKPSSKILFVGDGINDAPVLARVNVGVAMGGIGSDAAVEAADVVIINDEPIKIPMAIKIAKNTMKLVRQNISFALLVKFSVLILSATGVLVSMWLAIFADVGVTLLVVLNAMRKKI